MKAIFAILFPIPRNSSACILSLLLFSSTSLFAELLFSSDGVEITIAGSNPQASGSLVIPNTIDNLPVTSIGNQAFQCCSGLTSVTIGSGVTNIGDGAFSGCSGLTSVSIPNSVTSIGYQAFSGCSGLTSVTIGNSVTSIGGGMFSGCSRLTSVTIGSSVTYLDCGAFSGCSGLTSVTIPNSLTSIGYLAFSGCSGLTSVTIPNSVKDIGRNAFSECSGLTSVTIGNSVTSIGERAFYNCSGLTSVFFSGDALSDRAPNRGISYSAFENVYNTTVYYIQGKAGWGPSFAGFPTRVLISLTSPSLLTYVVRAGGMVITGSSPPATGALVIPSRIEGLPVTSIDSWAFENCTGLTSVTIPDSVTSIGAHVFAGCTRLESVSVAPLNPTYASVGGVLFNKTQTSLLLCPSGKIGDYTVPNTVTKIDSSAFSSCTRLTRVVMPDGLTSIGAMGFYGCTGLRNVSIPNRVAVLSYAAFYGCSGLTNIVISSSVISIEDSAFFGCQSLSSFTVDSSNPAYSSINGVLFNKAGTTLLLFPPRKAGAYVVPKTVTIIENSAFNSCTWLTSVRIPSSVVWMGALAFASCPELKMVYFEGDQPGIGYDVFEASGSASVNYIEGQAGWTSTFAGRSTATWILDTPPNTLIVEAAANFPNPIWTTVATNSVPSSGPRRFYRLRVPLIEVATDLRNPVWTPVATNNITTNQPQRFYRLVGK